MFVKHSGGIPVFCGFLLPVLCLDLDLDKSFWVQMMVIQQPLWSVLVSVLVRSCVVSTLVCGAEGPEPRFAAQLDWMSIAMQDSFLSVGEHSDATALYLWSELLPQLQFLW